MQLPSEKTIVFGCRTAAPWATCASIEKMTLGRKAISHPRRVTPNSENCSIVKRICGISRSFPCGKKPSTPWTPWVFKLLRKEKGCSSTSFGFTWKEMRLLSEPKTPISLEQKPDSRRTKLLDSQESYWR